MKEAGKFCINLINQIKRCDSYDIAKAKLKEFFVKNPNIIFFCHPLAMRKYKSGKLLEEFLQLMHVLSKDCNFRNVS